jgi:adenylate kinase
MESGSLVSDEIVLGLVEERVSNVDCANGFILDGFPRTIPQADSLFALLSGIGKKIDFVISLDVDNNELIGRLSGRRTCSACGKGFHLLYNQPKRDGFCDVCNSELVQRKDDAEETVVNRLNVYESQTSSLKSYYGDLGLLYCVSGTGSIADITSRVTEILDLGGIGDHS